MRPVGSTAALGVWVLGAAPTWAQGGAEPVGVGLWAILFLGLGALVVATRVVPAVVLLGALLRSLFAPAGDATEAAGEETSKA